jgi:predicted DNA binding CopG/RHH family protein
MSIDKEKNARIQVTVPKEMLPRLREIAAGKGLPLSQLFLQAVVEKYLTDEAQP